MFRQAVSNFDPILTDYYWSRHGYAGTVKHLYKVCVFPPVHCLCLQDQIQRLYLTVAAQ